MPGCHNQYLIKNISGVKKGQPRTKTGLAEKDTKSNGQPIPPGFDRLESFGHDKLTAKHCYFRCKRPPYVDEIKILIKMTRPLNIKIKTVFCSQIIFIKNFDPINIRRP